MRDLVGRLKTKLVPGIKQDLRRQCQKVENYRIAAAPCADELRAFMTTRGNRANVRVALMNYLSRFKGTPREAEARQAVNDWIDRNSR